MNRLPPGRTAVLRLSERMRGPLTQDDVDGLCARARTPEQHRRAAAQLAAWAEEVHPEDDEVSPASLLANAGEKLNRIGDHDAALEVFRHAVGAEGHVPPDVRCYLHHELLAVGDVAGARRLADELRLERPADGDVYLFVGESSELVGDLREAHRWMTAAHAGPGRAGGTWQSATRPAWCGPATGSTGPSIYRWTSTTSGSTGDGRPTDEARPMIMGLLPVSTACPPVSPATTP